MLLGVRWLRGWVDSHVQGTVTKHCVVYLSILGVSAATYIWLTLYVQGEDLAALKFISSVGFPNITVA